MSRKLHLLLLGLCVLGFAGGFAAKRALTAPERVGGDGEVAASEQRKSGARMERSGPPVVVPAEPTLRSADTLEDLLEFDDEELYPRLALWLLDAGAEEVAAFWEAYSKRRNRRAELAELIFVHWTRLDPRGAVAAVEGTADEGAAWRAWACTDPEEALTACLARKPEMVDEVARGIGEFRPGWLMDHLDLIPEERRHVALRGLAEGHGGDDPLAMLDLIQDHRALVFPGLVRTAVQRDPWATVEWFEGKGSRVVDQFGIVGPSQDLLSLMLAEYHPDVLEALVAREPAGARRRSMEEALFVRRLETDLEGAIEEARSTRAPRVAVERLARVGARLARSDPERAFEIMENIVARDDNPFHVDTRVHYPRGSSGLGGVNSRTFEEFVETLVARDPERLMQVGAEARPEGDAGSWERSIAIRWAAADFEGYAEWTAAQQVGEGRDFHLAVVADQLGGQERFAEASDWALSIGDETRRGEVLRNTLRSWVRRDPQGAARWTGAAPLTDAERERCENLLPGGREGSSP